MSLNPIARARIAELAKDLTSAPEAEIKRALMDDAASSLHDHLHLAREGKFTAAYAPFDWINDSADIVFVGVTPGLEQATDALKTLRRVLLAGGTIEAAAEASKASASFRGMRALAVWL